MMTVRFPNGTSIQYNRAGFCKYQTNFFELYVKEGGGWIASIPYASGGVIEAEQACRVYNPINERFQDRLFALEKEMRGLKRNLSKVLAGNSNKEK